MKLARLAVLAAALAVVAATSSNAFAQGPGGWDVPTGFGHAQQSAPDPEAAPVVLGTGVGVRDLLAMLSALPAGDLPGWVSFAPFRSVAAVRSAVLPGERRGASSYAVNRRPTQVTR